MDFLALVPVFIFGTIIGSFLNVVIYRYNSGTSPITGRSQCFACGRTLEWYELVPVFSFLAQKGKCRKCKTKLSWQYPAVEILTGGMFIAVFLLGKPVLETTYLLVIFSTLIVIAVYDLRHQIIPDGLSAFFALASLLWFLCTIPGGYQEAFRFPYYWTLVAGPMLFFPFWALWFVSQGRWLGLGDGKLALGIGWFLGATLGGSAIMLAFWVGAAYALAIMAVQKIAVIVSELKVGSSAFHSAASKTRTCCFVNIQHSAHLLSLKSEIPFGPFLILAVFIVYFTGVNFFDGSVTFFTFL